MSLNCLIAEEKETMMFDSIWFIVLVTWPFAGIIAGIFDAWRLRFRATYGELLFMSFLGYALLAIVVLDVIFTATVWKKFLSKIAFDFREQK
jgi:uncharacterized membrane protein